MKYGLSSIYIIAEAGVNHCGDLNLARKLIEAASDCGVLPAVCRVLHCQVHQVHH